MKSMNSFRPLIWGYLWNHINVTIAEGDTSFRPLIWGYLWNQTSHNNIVVSYRVSVPLFGAISEIKAYRINELLGKGFRPLIWGYLWNLKERVFIMEEKSFRPLIWGYLWN